MMNLIFLFIVGFIELSEGNGGCKVLNYLQCQKNKTFTGHMIESFRVLAPGLDMCQHKCFLEDRCVSYNLGPTQGMVRSCDLNDVDHVSDPGHVVSKKDFEYCPIKNPCSSNPCSSNQWCTPDFLWNSFKCSDGRWTQWSGWSECVCPKTRTRRCITPQYTAGLCDGQDKDAPKKCKAVTDIEGCSEPLGMEDGRITDDQITASSHFSSNCLPYYGRLHRPTTSKIYDSSWCAKKAQIGHYLQVDVGAIKWLTKIATQGRGIPNFYQWVTEYTLSFSNNTNTWQEYKVEQPCTKHFSGNEDRNSVMTQELSIPIKARYVRIIPKKWNGWISMRAELYGC